MPDLALQQWLQLTLCWRFNAQHLKALFHAAGSVGALKELPTEILGSIVDLPVQAQSSLVAWQNGVVADETRRLVDDALAWALQPGHHIIPYGAADYPHLLSTCADPPPQLFVRGDVAALQLPQVAMVGSRKPTADGRKLARRFARDLVDSGYRVTSGLALGIDAESHEGALDRQGRTIAVLGSGLNRVYPTTNARLAERIVEQGALVSEFPPETAADSWHFPERNRIISGLSHGVLVVEAAERSGSLITARFAAEQGREVFAIPGSINNPLARGCHRLIRQGARLVENVDDILAELPALVAWERDRLENLDKSAASDPERENKTDLPPQARRVLRHVAYDPVSVDSLALHTALPMPELLGCLLQLELLGLVSAREGHYVLSNQRAHPEVPQSQPQPGASDRATERQDDARIRRFNRCRKPACSPFHSRKQ